MRIAVLVPSRGRPDRAALMAQSVIETSGGRVSIVLIVDADDPELEAYRAGLPKGAALVVLPERVGYTASLNAVAGDVWDDFDVLGAFGDDVLFRSFGWDQRVAETLAEPSIAYGDDLIHGRNHPSAVFMSSAIAKALGWLALPATTHQWADDGWKRLGQELGVLRYMSDVVVEHLHPAVHKAEWDATYESVFEADRAKRDYEGFTAWAETDLAGDAAKVRAALAIEAAA